MAILKTVHTQRHKNSMHALSCLCSAMLAVSSKYPTHGSTAAGITNAAKIDENNSTGLSEILLIEVIIVKI